MSYQVLARKWRPKSFDALVGQEHVVRALTNALQQQRLHHAYLFTGTRGVGKTTLSRILAKSLNCELGVSATPCGQCAACVAIDKGSFLDYVEMDAASNRGVEDMTSLLEKAIYAPTQGRYKVYMLDEVHQLTGHAFNAMLKTLEEPPAHVKFILATTDPQKVPVTILSRCLQFNLRQMSSSGIAEHLQHVLAQENIAFEPVALQLIGRSANGSMRDALSLLDQAIAYGGNSVNEKEVRAMLGAIDQAYLFDLINALLARDGNALLSQARAMEQRAISFDAALNDLANLLHEIAIAQAVPDSIAHDHPERQAMLDIAARMSAEEIQLYYQIALLARRDLGLAPDEFAGFTMALLRMLAFNPGEQKSPAKAKPAAVAPPVAAESATPRASAALAISQPVAKIAAPSITTRSVEATPELAPPPSEPAPQPAPVSAPASSVEDTPVSAVTRSFDGDWRGLVDRLKLGLARALAQNCELASFDEEHIAFSVPPTQKHLLGMGYEEKLQSAVEQHFGRKIKMTFALGGSGNTPAQLMSQEKAALQAHAENAIHNDGFVQALIKDFGAQIIPSSIKPLQ
ncbi:DNA polymerase III subunit gamma/tau [Methylobacillus flagellatus]|uniref:DNA polymerase III subunit gamma/tau n=1 Tax=Methylobacillus flagellatus TaxID=405 RepID=UPI002853E9BF|nr:DNA polymerase III subunit gamma/tau [Methylobacillus flagellatus]MDR5171521.1 DNA polymerase III subunit gamma/tau [Methylobacillus flagellatus]